MSVLDEFYANAAKGSATVRNPVSADSDIYTTPDEQLSAPASVGETFGRGVKAGALGIESDLNYFKALGNTLVGDEESAKDNIAKANQVENQSARLSAGMESFEEFLEEPTFGGFVDQVAKSTGQLLPYAISSISSAGIGAVVAVAGRGTARAVSRKAAERLVKDSIENTAKGIGTQAEKEVAQSAYELAKKGAYTGAYLSEAIPLSGANVREAVEAGQELDSVQAFRALALGAGPQAVAGVFGEAAFAKMVARVARERSAGNPQSIYGRVANDFGRGFGSQALVQTGTELVQEGISVANRMDLDEQFTREDASLRLGETAFASFFGGGTLGGAGRVAAGTVRDASSIMGKARDYVDAARSKRVDDLANEQEFGPDDGGLTRAESLPAISAQIEAMFDDSSTKKAVWVEGRVPFSGATEGVREVEIDGKKMFAAFVPGRGTILSQDADTVSFVAREGATDQVLASTLGYSATKPADGDRVVRVTNADGQIVSEEVTNEAGLAAAMEAGNGLMPDGGKVEVVSPQQTLRERRSQYTPEEETDLQNQEGYAEFDAELLDQRNYAGRQDKTKIYGATEDLRTRFEREFESEMDVNWEEDQYGLMSDSFLRQALDAAARGLTVEFNFDPEKNSHQLSTYNFGESFTTQVTEKRDGKTVRVTKRLPLKEFLEAEISRARGSQLSRDSNVVLVTPDGKRTRTNLVDLTNAGRRINETRDGQGFTGDNEVGSQAAGLTTILSELMQEGYSLEADVAVQDRSPIDTQQDPEMLTGAPDSQAIPTVTTGTVDLMSVLDELASGVATPTQEIIAGRTKDAEGNFTNYTITDLLRNQANPFNLARKRNADTRELEPGADPRMDREDFIEDDAATDPERLEPSPQGGIDGPVSAVPPRFIFGDQNRSPKTPSKREYGARFPLGEPSKFLQSLVRQATQAMKLSRPVTILMRSQLEQLQQEGPNALGDYLNVLGEETANSLMNAAGQMNPKFGGFLMNDSTNEYVIVINDVDFKNDAERALVIAHELGHALYKEETDRIFNNNELRTRLIQAYAEARAKEPEYFADLERSYFKDDVFEEWFADQVSRAYKQRLLNKKPTNLTESFFHQLVKRLQTLFNAIKSYVAQRNVPDPEAAFSDYFDTVIATRANRERNAEIGIYVPKLVTRIKTKATQMKLSQTRGLEESHSAIMGIIRSRFKANRGFFSLFLTADGILRGISPRLADMFYVQAQQSGKKGKLGFLKSYFTNYRRLRNDFEDRVGDIDDPAVQDALREAASSKTTAELTGKALEIRKFLEDVYTGYIEPSQRNYADKNKIGFIENYFPRLLDLVHVSAESDRFAALIKEFNPELDDTFIQQAIARIIAYNDAVASGGPDIQVQNPLDPAAGQFSARVLTANIPADRLAEFTQAPDIAIAGYMRSVAKRIEWQKATTDESGNSLLPEMLDNLDDQDRASAEKIIQAYLGHQNSPLSPLMRQVNSWGQLLQFITILPFATIASFPELAGPILNFKGFDGFRQAAQEMIYQFRNRDEAVKFARDVAVTSGEAMSTAWVSEADLDYMDPVAADFTDRWFKVTGLNFFTRFTREFAAGMGRRFLIQHAYNPTERSERYLADLGVTADQVKAFFDNEQDVKSPEAEAVRQAVTRFVESSILRPNAAERPIWASDPRYALIWQLKGYLWSFYKTIVGGLMREVRQTKKETRSIPAMSALFALAAVAFLPLAALSMETREWVKFGLASGSGLVDGDKDYFRTDRMDWGEYTFNLIDRSGFLGPWSLVAMMHQSAEWGRSPLSPLLGPSAETLETVLRDGWKSFPNRLAPIYNQL